jgi:hypothetical protein
MTNLQIFVAAFILRPKNLYLWRKFKKIKKNKQWPGHTTSIPLKNN